VIDIDSSRAQAYSRRMPNATRAEDMRAVLSGESNDLTRFRAIMKRIPSGPHCKLCAAPFNAPGGSVLRHFGFGRFPGNPALCNNCIQGFRKHDVYGAEIPVSLVFADVRGSTGIGEGMRPVDFHAFLSRFYRIASSAILDRDGVVDKLVGDEVIGLFFGGITGPGHAAAAIDAATELVTRVGRADASAIGAIPVGAAVHTGVAYVGATGPVGAVDDFTALGDPVNTTARLAALASAGEIFVSCDAIVAAGRDRPDDETRVVDVRGRQEPIEVVVLKAGAGDAS
jgi:adenylate cyclase